VSCTNYIITLHYLLRAYVLFIIWYLLFMVRCLLFTHQLMACWLQQQLTAPLLVAPKILVTQPITVLYSTRTPSHTIDPIPERIEKGIHEWLRRFHNSMRLSRLKNCDSRAFMCLFTRWHCYIRMTRLRACWPPWPRCHLRRAIAPRLGRCHGWQLARSHWVFATYPAPRWGRGTSALSCFTNHLVLRQWLCVVDFAPWSCAL
jgi:hypothetical protein